MVNELIIGDQGIKPTNSKEKAFAKFRFPDGETLLIILHNLIVMKSFARENSCKAFLFVLYVGLLENIDNYTYISILTLCVFNIYQKSTKLLQYWNILFEFSVL